MRGYATHVGLALPHGAGGAGDARAMGGHRPLEALAQAVGLDVLGPWKRQTASCDHACGI